MRTITLLLAGALAGVVMTLATVLVAGGWYEYHLADPAAHDNPIMMVNHDGWELMPMGQLRRPRFRLH